MESRKKIIEQMGVNLAFHEKECADLAKKLTILKQQILDNDSGYGMSKKFGCVKIGRLKDTVCTVSTRAKTVTNCCFRLNSSLLKT